MEVAGHNGSLVCLLLLLLYTILNKTNTLCRQMEVAGLKKGQKMGRDLRHGMS